MTSPLTHHVDLPISGMTCASCANRIERRLNRLDGVSASVNYATEKATVDYDPATVATDDLLGAVEAAGYRAALPATEPGHPAGHEHHDPDEQETAELRRRVVICAVLSLPVLLMAMIPALQFDNWQWLSLQLATPVVLWGAWPFHRAAWANLKHGVATMDTLISMGVLAAWLWSLVALFFGDAGMNGMTMPFELVPERGAGMNDIYLEVASVVTTLILLGRYFEARAKHRTGAAIRSLAGLRPDRAAVLRDGVEVEIPIAEVLPGDLLLVRPGAPNLRGGGGTVATLVPEDAEAVHWLLRAGCVLERWRALRPLAVAFVAVLAYLAFSRSKPYYAAPAFVLVFAAGGAQFVEHRQQNDRDFLVAALQAFQIIGEQYDAAHQRRTGAVATRGAIRSGEASLPPVSPGRTGPGARAAGSPRAGRARCT